MNIIKAKSDEKEWGIDLGGLARIWKGGCIIRAQFLDRIKQAYRRDPKLPNLLVRAHTACGGWGFGLALPTLRTTACPLLFYPRNTAPPSNHTHPHTPPLYPTTTPHHHHPTG